MPGCPSSRASISTTTRKATPSTSARPARLRDRTRSYLGAYGMSPRHDALLDEASRVEVIVTDSVVEALALENNLIKQRSPHYNILLRDDKNYPYLQLTTTEAFPRVLVARSVERDGNVYAGPVPAREVRAPHDGADPQGVRHPVVQRGDHRARGTGRASNTTSSAAWRRAWRRSAPKSAMRWRWPTRSCFSKAATRSWRSSCAGACSRRRPHERFEEAAQLRDAMRTVQAVRERQQKMASAELGDRDVFGVKVGASGAVVQVFIVRGGRVIERVEFVWDARRERRVRGRRDRGRDPAVLCRSGAAARDSRAGGAARAAAARRVARRRRRAARCASSCRSAAPRRA